MKTDLTDITFVLDRSGSMGAVKRATIEAFNNFLRSQRNGVGVGRMSLTQFDHEFEDLYTALPLGAAPELNDATYIPRGNTALLDAIGRSIVATGRRLREMLEEDRPATVLFVILTDGFENASREFTPIRINEMISEQREKYGWQFIFLGANQDAIVSARAMGMEAAQALTFAASPGGTEACFNALDQKLHLLRQRRADGDLETQLKFDQHDRDSAGQHRNS